MIVAMVVCIIVLKTRDVGLKKKLMKTFQGKRGFGQKIYLREQNEI
jgi:hypothetical protein